MPPPPAVPGNHFIVCGDNPLAYRIARELTRRYGEPVVVLLPDKLKNHGPQLAELRGVTVREHAGLTGEAFADAGIGTARALALVGQDDLENFHAALRAQELSPDLRLVVAARNRRLGDHIGGLLPDCTVLSRSQLAAPALVAAALGEIAPSHVRLSGRTLYVARRGETPGGQVLCGLSVPAEGDGVVQLVAPENLDGAALVLAVADGTPRDPLTRERHPLRAALVMGKRLVWNRYGAIAGVLLAVAVAGFSLLAAAGYGPSDVLYLGIMDMTGSALTKQDDLGPEKVAQVMLTADGMALLPLVTAIIVGARLTGQVRGAPRPNGGHVIVIGGGDVGMRVTGGLHDLGFDVVLVDRNESARGVALARNLGLPVVIGDALSERTLPRAGLDSAIALVSATSNDMVNLETALQARALRGEDLRIVLRLFDDDLAHRVSGTLGGNVVSRSVSYLAAPAFAAAMLEHRVLRTISVDRHVLVIADVRVEPEAAIAGQPLTELERDGLARTLAIAPRGTPRFDWSPRRDLALDPGDRLIVLATRAGLSTFLAASRPVATP
jgi:Trk K+ transport system NAD-binding subunit